MSEPTKILICVFTTHERNGWPTREIVELVERTRTDTNPKYGVAFTSAHNFIPAAGARNVFARHAKESEADWLLMIDNDMVVPANLLDTIKDAPADADIIVPQFHLWDGTKGIVKLCWGMEESQMVNGKFQIEPKFYEVTKAGTGAMFIKREVFHKLSPPWFWYTLNEDQCITATEDINFCTKARAAGLKIYGNGAIKVGHNHNVDLAVLARMLYEQPEKKIDNQTKLGSESELELPELAKSPSAVPATAACPAC